MLPALCALLGACGGSDEGGSAATTLPSCAEARTRIERPRTLPRGFPVPPGTVFTSSERPFPEQHVVHGLSPGDLDGVRSFYGEALEQAGYREGPGESESGETEALFSGRGVRGGWRANELTNCDGAVRLTLVIVRA